MPSKTELNRKLQQLSQENAALRQQLALERSVQDSYAGYVFRTAAILRRYHRRFARHRRSRAKRLWLRIRGAKMTEAITEIVATLKADNDRLRAERRELSSEVQRLRGMTYRNQ